MIKLLIPLVLISFSAFADHEPIAETFNSYVGNIKVFKRAKRFTYFTHLAIGSTYESNTTSLVKFGFYHKLSRAHKWGAFIRNQQGIRHTDDWVEKELDIWEWGNTSNRNEQVATLAYRYSIRAGSFPLHFRFQTELEKNFRNLNERIIFRPSMNYFHFASEGVNFSFHYSPSIYYALNFEDVSLYKRGHYFALLYHLSRRYQVGINYSTIDERWTAPSQEFVDLGFTEKYDVTDTINTFGVEFIIQI